MPDPLSVSPTGLAAGAAGLGQLAAELGGGTAPAVTSDEECSAAAGGGGVRQGVGRSGRGSGPEVAGGGGSLHHHR